MDKNLQSQLSGLIKAKQEENVRVLNGELITMFWSIGQILHTLVRDGSLRKTVNSLSKNLSLIWGPYFSAAGMNAMFDLYKFFPDQKKLKYISSVIGWDQLRVLVQQENGAAFKFYLWATVNNGLIASALQRDIASKKFEDFEEKNLPRKNVFPGLNGAILNQGYLENLVRLGLNRQQTGMPAIRNLFQLSAFRRLMNPSAKRIRTGYSKGNYENHQQLPLSDISDLINQFMEGQNRRLNASLNIMFWNIGKLINENIFAAVETQSQATLIRILSKQLMAEFGKSFNEKRLSQFSLFHKQVPNFKHAVRLSYLLPFGYINTLLSVQPMEAKFYYARAAALNAEGISELRKKIIVNEHLNKRHFLKQEEYLMRRLENPITKTVIKTKRNNAERINSEYLDFGDDLNDSLLIGNIFKNSDFRNLHQ